MNAKRREQFERIKAEVAPDLSVHLLDGMGREAMVASDAALLASGTAARVYAGEMPDGGGISHEAFYLLVGEAAGEN